MKPRIHIVYTGGTIGMIEDAKTGALKPFDFDHLIDNVPKVAKLNYEISSTQLNPPIDSSDMNPDHWQAIVRAIADAYEAHDGFVVLHGTDTMAYTASALSFMLGNLHKPVILTGSQLPIGEIREDGTENLIAALEIAAAIDPQSGQPWVQEVAIAFGGYLLRGNRAVKVSSTNFGAFESPNYPPLGSMDLHIRFNRSRLWRPAGEGPLDARLNLDSSVGVLFLFPGFSRDNLRHQLSDPSIKAFVLRTFGAGNAPTDQDFIDAIADACKDGKLIVNVTQCLNGGVEARRYASGDALTEAGAITGLDMTFEAAVSKLMYLLGRGLSRNQVAEYMRMSLCGELTPPTA